MIKLGLVSHFDLVSVVLSEKSLKLGAQAEVTYPHPIVRPGVLGMKNRFNASEDDSKDPQTSDPATEHSETYGAANHNKIERVHCDCKNKRATAYDSLVAHPCLKVASCTWCDNVILVNPEKSDQGASSSKQVCENKIYDEQEILVFVQWLTTFSSLD